MTIDLVEVAIPAVISDGRGRNRGEVGQVGDESIANGLESLVAGGERTGGDGDE